MNVREVGMLVSDGLMLMGMRMRFRWIPLEIMRVLMMLVVPMPMVMPQELVRMGMLMPLANMKPHAESHQRGGNPEKSRRQFRPERER